MTALDLHVSEAVAHDPYRLYHLAEDRQLGLIRPATPTLDTEQNPVSHNSLHRIRRR